MEKSKVILQINKKIQHIGEPINTSHNKITTYNTNNNAFIVK